MKTLLPIFFVLLLFGTQSLPCLAASPCLPTCDCCSQEQCNDCELSESTVNDVTIFLPTGPGETILQKSIAIIEPQLGSFRKAEAVLFVKPVINKQSHPAIGPPTV
ncbi:MAG: hypothetical protein ABIE84_02730 [bacterium]